jgi:hypothetical protein
VNQLKLQSQMLFYNHPRRRRHPTLCYMFCHRHHQQLPSIQLSMAQLLQLWQHLR